MRGIFTLFLHAIVTIIRLGQPGGLRSVVAESEIQPKLLHVTETLAVDRIGGRKPIPVDFRLIVATNRNLEEMVRQGKFRDDLYDRLNVVSICVPPLRARMEDIPLLVDYFISDCAGEARRMVTGAAPQVLDLFQQYSWPGNIRELRNIVKRCVFTGRTESIRQEDLSFDFAQRLASPPVNLGNYDEQLRELSRQLVRSEERRVGKECRSWWARYYYKE